MRPIEAVIARAIWDVDLGRLPTWRVHLTRAARVLHAVLNDLGDGQLTLRAMRLVYTTLLSLVPLLALSFSVLKGFGVHNQIEPLLANLLAPLGERGPELTATIIGFVENMQVGVLGSLGLALLLYTVVSLIQKIESAFNYVWHTTQTRSIGQRFGNYLSVIMVGPVLLFAAMGLSASLMNAELVQRLFEVEAVAAFVSAAGRIVPWLLVVGAFAFVYAFVPSTRVRLVPALVGASLAAFLWQLVGWAFASVVVSSVKYTAIYSGFAIVLVLMIWVYLSWLILLFGAAVSFYVQHPEYVAPHRQEATLSSRLKERIALLLMARIARDHVAGGPPGTTERLAGWLGVPMDVIGGVLDALEASELLLRTSGEPAGYVPSRALDRMPVGDVLDAVRRAEETAYLSSERLPPDREVDALLDELERAREQALGERNLRDLGSANR